MRTWSAGVVVVVVVVGVVGVATGCGEDPRAAAEDAVFDKLTCEELARPSTLARVRAALDRPSFDTVAAVVDDPQDVATLVSVAGPEVEGTVIVVRNLFDISPKTRALVAHGFDGFDFACDDGEQLDCTAGSETVSVSCDKRGDADAVDVVLDKCTVGGVVVDGAVTLVKDGDHGVRAIFDALSIDENKVITGDARVHGTAFTTAGDDGGLRITDFGGPDSGLGCGEELQIRTLAFTSDDDDSGAVHVALSGSRATAEEGTWEIESDLRYDGGCACPLPGSRLSIATPDTGTIAVAYDDGAQGSCATATAAWDAFPAAGDALSSMFTALCATP